MKHSIQKAIHNVISNIRKTTNILDFIQTKRLIFASPNRRKRRYQKNKQGVANIDIPTINPTFLAVTA
jgi:hypothetical protein